MGAEDKVYTDEAVSIIIRDAKTGKVLNEFNETNKRNDDKPKLSSIKVSSDGTEVHKTYDPDKKVVTSEVIKKPTKKNK